MATQPLPAPPLVAALPTAESGTGGADSLRRKPRFTAEAIWATALAVAGVFSLWPTVLLLWSLWTTDALKSIGGFVPLVSLALTLRVWRALHWELNGTWWGLALLTTTVAAVHLRDRAVLELVLSPRWSITLPPHSVVAFAYASGVVLLFGGVRLWKAALFPLSLMLLVNPVPHAFTRLVDLPLQHVSAETARALAHALGQRLTPDQLTLMFTPDFGMFIAPGCDGIRGSITMGMIALVAGYLYRFRAGAWALLVGSAVLLGYLFNLVRLCVLVGYYVVALRWYALQGHAEGADYCLGATLFFVATMLLFAAIRRMGGTGDLRIPPVRTESAPERMIASPQIFWWRWSGFAALTVVGAIPYVQFWRQPIPVSAATGVHGGFPETLGKFRLQRTWPETLATGQTIFQWAAYASPSGGSVVEVGVSPVLGAHDTLLCHAARGEDWLWHGSLTFGTPTGPVEFSGSLFNDGATQYMEATTVCSASGCGQWTSERKHFGLVYSRPDLRSLASPAAGRPIPVLMRVEMTDATMPSDAARTVLTAQLRSFLAGASPQILTLPYRSSQRP